MSNHTTKGGNVVLNDISLPDAVQPGAGPVAEINVINGATYINPLDPDFCGGGGYRLRAWLVEPDGTEHPSGWTCVPSTLAGTRGETFSLSFTAPEDVGDYQYEAYVEMEGSGKTTGRLTQTLTVNEREAEYPEDDDDSNHVISPEFGDNDPYDDVVPDAEDALGIDPQMMLWVVLAIAALYSFGQGFDIDLGNGGRAGA